MRTAFALALALALASPVSWSASPDAVGQQQGADASFARGAALPAWAEPLTEPPGTERGDAYVMRVSETQVMVGKTPEVLVHQAIQVNDRGALSVIGQFRISFVPAYQKLALHRVAILRGDKAIDHTATVNVRLLDREENLDNGVYGGARFAQLLLDDVRVGDTLVIDYSLAGANPVFGERWADDLSWDKPYPTELRRVVVMHPQDRPVKWRQVGDYNHAKITPVIDRRGALVRMRFEGRGLDAVDLEPSIPNDYLPLRTLQFTEYRDWNEVANWAAGLFPKVAPSAGLTELAGQFSKLEGKERQASAALRWVQDEIRYFSVSLGENSHRPQPPEVVLKRRFGDCKDKSYLLASLLAELGIRAQPVLVNATAPETPAKVLATPGWFDHAIVRVELDGKVFYVDPTRSGERAMISELPVAVSGAQGLVVSPATTALTRLPDDDATYPLIEYVEKLDIADMEGDAKLEARQVYRGRYASSARVGLGGTSANELKKFVLERVEKTYPGIRLDRAPEIRDSEDGTVIQLVSHFTVPKPVKLKDGYHAVNVDSHILEGTLGIPDKVVRNFPFALPMGRYRGRFRMQIMWPASVRYGSTSYGETIDNPYFYSHYEYARLGRQLDFQYDYRLKSATVPAAGMPALHEQAEKLGNEVVNSLRVHESALSAYQGKDYTLRHLEAVSAMTHGREVADFLDDKARRIDAENVNGLCDSIRMLDAAGRAVAGSRKLVDAAMRSLEKTSGVPGTQRCVARLLFAQAKYRQALAAFGADMPEPSDDAWRELAWARFAAGDASGAVRDAEARRLALAQDGRPDAFAAMDSMALHQRARKPLPPDLAAFARSPDGGTWPRPILMMQAGLVTPEDVLRAAEAFDGDARAIAVNDARVYIAHYWLARGDRARALAALGWYPQHGLPSTLEHKLAFAELDRLQFGDADYQAGLAVLAADRTRAEAKFNAAARRGVAAAQFRLGVMRYDEEAYAAALPWLEKAGTNGSADALNLLATIYERGLGVPADDARATGLLQQAAASHGHPEASARLGERYREGKGATKDAALALRHFIAAAELGNPRAQQAVAEAYAEGRGAERNDALAYLWAEHAHAGGNLAGTMLLAQLLADGRGTNRDLARAVRLWGDAADGGSTAAQLALGKAYEAGTGVGRDLAHAKRLYARAAAAGDLQAQFRHAIVTMGDKPSADEAAKVVESLGKLANEGKAEASYMLAAFYMTGKGVPKDVSAAVRHYKAAAALGHERAQVELGMVYHFGEDGAEKNYAEAIKWYREGEKHRNASAINNLADMYENGNGLKQDYATALKMYHESAQLGGATALLSLGHLYEYGRGVKKDPYMAYVFFTLAANRGLEEGYAGVGRMARRLSREQLAAALELASAWKQGRALPDEAPVAGEGGKRAK